MPKQEETLTGIHFLLTYQCTNECDHCFLHCGPQAEGTFTISQVQQVLKEIAKTKSIDNVYFEGGEPFLFYPLMVESIRQARKQGLDVGIVSNAYWAKSPEDAELWLKPLAKLGISDLSLSDDLFHQESLDNSPAKIGRATAKKLGIPADTICIGPAKVENSPDSTGHKGEPVVGGGVKFRGRAVEKLTADLPRRSWKQFTSCPHEELEHPGRVHIDSYGNVHLCQGLLMGNMWQTPLSTLIKNYDVNSHPICGPLIKGGPAQLAQQYEVALEEGYIDECHLCYLTRQSLIDRFPQYLSPKQVYGLEDTPTHPIP